MDAKTKELIEKALKAAWQPYPLDPEQQQIVDDVCSALSSADAEVARLRKIVEVQGHALQASAYDVKDSLGDIGKLTRENARLREALEAMLFYKFGDQIDLVGRIVQTRGLAMAVDLARAALSPQSVLEPEFRAGQWYRDEHGNAKILMKKFSRNIWHVQDAEDYTSGSLVSEVIEEKVIRNWSPIPAPEGGNG